MSDKRDLGADIRDQDVRVLFSDPVPQAEASLLNMIIRRNIKTVGELIDIAKANLLDWRQTGPKRAYLLKQKLEGYGLRSIGIDEYLGFYSPYQYMPKLAAQSGGKTPVVVVDSTGAIQILEADPSGFQTLSYLSTVRIDSLPLPEEVLGPLQLEGCDTILDVITEFVRHLRDHRP